MFYCPFSSMQASPYAALWTMRLQCSMLDWFTSWRPSPGPLWGTLTPPMTSPSLGYELSSTRLWLHQVGGWVGSVGGGAHCATNGICIKIYHDIYSVYVSHWYVWFCSQWGVYSVFPATYTSLAWCRLQYTKQAMKAGDMWGAGSEDTLCFSWIVFLAVSDKDYLLIVIQDPSHTWTMLHQHVQMCVLMYRSDWAPECFEHMYIHILKIYICVDDILLTTEIKLCMRGSKSWINTCT